ncbi:hypothetical protein G6F31_016884 [Rhizopus arrhizus]|nr:hypothetical protein G6F31_016884 [Rhizopus arrhizus]
MRAVGASGVDAAGFAVQPFDDRRRRAGRGQHRVPRNGFEVGIALRGHRRDARQRFAGLQAGHGQQLDLAIAGLRPGAGRHHEAGLHVAADDGGDDLRESGVGDVRQVYARAFLEHLHGQVGRAAGAHRTVVQRIAAAFDQLDEVLDVVDLQAARHDQHVGAGAHQRDGSQVGERVVAQRLLSSV